MTSVEHRELFPEVPIEFLEPDVVADLDTDRLGAIDSQSQDFVICSHVLEHLADPLGFLDEVHRVLRVGGSLLMLLPDRRYTFDRNREPTPLDCVIRDHAVGTTTPDDEHMLEFLLGADQGPDFSLPEDPQARADLFAWHRARSIHVHCWTDGEFREVLQYCSAELGHNWESVDYFTSEQGEGEFGFVLTRAKRRRPRRFARQLEPGRRYWWRASVSTSSSV